MVTVSALVFECRAKACAPPPAGKGGSLPGKSSRGQNALEQGAIDRHLAVKKAWQKAKKANLHQDGTTNRPNAGGIGGGSAGKKGAGKSGDDDKWNNVAKLAYARAAGKTKKGAKKRPNITYVNSQESG